MQSQEIANSRPQRKRLPHALPSWVTPGSRFFISINALPRGGNRLCCNGRAEALLDGFIHYHASGDWHATVALIMPDHLHAVLAFNPQKSIVSTIASWKGYHAKRLGIEWQSGFFDHRLRDEQEEFEKCLYIRQNPVRKELVDQAEDWPYVWPKVSIDG